MIKAHYFGEFGYFNFIMLGHLYDYFEKHPEPIELLTFPDYMRILRLVFPNNIKESIHHLQTDIHSINSACRKYHTIICDELQHEMKVAGYIRLDHLVGGEIADWVEGRKKIKTIPRPIFLNKFRKQYVSVVCRNRILDPDRNLTAEVWKELMNIIREEYPQCPIVLHGLRDEVVPLTGDFLNCWDIEASIGYLNSSVFFLSSMSGFAQFASNCGCHIMQIGKQHQMIPYNPFNKINICLSEISKFRSEIRRFSPMRLL